MRYSQENKIDETTIVILSIGGERPEKFADDQLNHAVVSIQWSKDYNYRVMGGE